MTKPYADLDTTRLIIQEQFNREAMTKADRAASRIERVIRLCLFSFAAAACFLWVITRPLPELLPAKAFMTIDKSAPMQQQRRDLIDKMIALDLFTKTGQNGTNMPRAWVTPQFQALDYQEQEQALQAVYGYYLDGIKESDSLAIIDSRTGAEIGRYRPGDLDLKENQ